MFRQFMKKIIGDGCKWVPLWIAGAGVVLITLSGCDGRTVEGAGVPESPEDHLFESEDVPADEGFPGEGQGLLDKQPLEGGEDGFTEEPVEAIDEESLDEPEDFIEEGLDGFDEGIDEDQGYEPFREPEEGTEYDPFDSLQGDPIYEPFDQSMDEPSQEFPDGPKYQPFEDAFDDPVYEPFEDPFEKPEFDPFDDPDLVVPDESFNEYDSLQTPEDEQDEFDDGAFDTQKEEEFMEFEHWEEDLNDDL